MRSASNSSDIVIVGAGMAGLAAAIALTDSGRHVRVIEQAAAPREVGAGIQVGPNAVKVLARLGIARLDRAGAATPDALTVRDAHGGATIARARLGDWIHRRHGAPYHTMARADMLAALLARAEELGIDIEHGAGLARLQRRADRFLLDIEGGRRLETSVLVGADGLWSRVRKAIRPTHETRFTGQTAWRTLLPMEAVPDGIAHNDVTLWIAPGFHAVHYPVSGRRRLNLALFTEGPTDATGWDTPGDRDDLRRRIEATGRPLAGPLDALVAAARDFVKWPLFAIEPSIAWGVGASTLIGDAAHPMLPYLAQGAAMGFEDALALAVEVRRWDSAEAAFRAFERTRARRVMRVQRSARANARAFHLSGPAALARNAVLGLGERLVPGALLRRYDWLYGGGPAA